MVALQQGAELETKKKKKHYLFLGIADSNVIWVLVPIPLTDVVNIYGVGRRLVTLLHKLKIANEYFHITSSRFIDVCSDVPVLWCMSVCSEYVCMFFLISKPFRHSTSFKRDWCADVALNLNLRECSVNKDDKNLYQFNANQY